MKGLYVVSTFLSSAMRYRFNGDTIRQNNIENVTRLNNVLTNINYLLLDWKFISYKSFMQKISQI
jgi:hypothetical protein